MKVPHSPDETFFFRFFLFAIRPLVPFRRRVFNFRKKNDMLSCVRAPFYLLHFTRIHKRSTCCFLFCFLHSRAARQELRPSSMMRSAMGRLVSVAAMFLGQAGLASAAPTCTRVASQWAVVFPADCTMWFEQLEDRQELSPETCSQVRRAAVNSCAVHGGLVCRRVRIRVLRSKPLCAVQDDPEMDA